RHLDSLGATISPNTARNYRARVRGFLAWLDSTDDSQWHGEPLGDIRTARVVASAYRSHLLTVRNAKPETVNGHLSALDALTSYLGLGRATESDSRRSQRVTVPERAPRALEPAEVKRLLNYTQQLPDAERVVAELLYYSALRLGELVALDLDDVPMTARTGHIIVREGKGGKPRTVPISRELRPLLERHRGERLRACNGTGEGCPLIVGRRGERLGDVGVRRRVAALGEAVGIDGLTPHVLRHSAITRMVRTGVDLVTVAEIAGHSRLETTRRYSAPTDADVAAALDTLDLSDVQAVPA